MRRRGAIVALPTTLAAILAVPTTALAQAKGKPSVGGQFSGNLTGTTTDAAGVIHTFNGIGTVEQFTAQGGALQAAVRVVGQVTNSLGGVTPVNETLQAPANAQGTCEILNLVIGPIYLDLLGLVIETNQIEIQIRAERGPGNLLGNLLCAIVGLLDQPNLLANLLNRLLGLFR
jgi:hypothetical protein